MAKTRFPKNSTDVKANATTPNNQPSLTDSKPDTSIGLAEAPATEIVKTEPRANLVPINVEEEVRRLAYLLAERRGFEPGHESEDWLAAEREVRQRYRQQSA